MKMKMKMTVTQGNSYILHIFAGLPEEVLLKIFIAYLMKHIVAHDN